MNLERIRGQARNHIEQIMASDLSPSSWPPPASPVSEAERSNFSDLIATLAPGQRSNYKWTVLERILVLEFYLRQTLDGASDHTLGPQAAASLREWITIAALPNSEFAPRSPYAISEVAELTQDDIAKYRALGLRSLQVIFLLEDMYPFSKDEQALVVSMLTYLASYSDASAPWTCSKAQSQAQLLSSLYVDSQSLPRLISELLKQRVKPLFTKSKNPAITPQIRKAIHPLPSDETAQSDLDIENKPWKHEHIYVISLLQWIYENLDAASMESNWPLLVPPLLALIDDSSIDHKAKGCRLLLLFLKSSAPSLLQRTGLGEVFESALFPCLNYLPSVTLEADSSKILEVAYPALIYLAIVRFPDAKQRAAKTKAFNKILHQGILQGFAHAGDHVKIAELLINQMTDLINETGVASTTNLKHILPFLSANLAAPFATAYPPLLQASASAMKVIIINGWPRIAYHRFEILRGLTICWCRIKEVDDNIADLTKVKETIEQAVELLMSAVWSGLSAESEIRNLVRNEPRLQTLLAIPEAYENQKNVPI